MRVSAIKNARYCIIKREKGKMMRKIKLVAVFSLIVCLLLSVPTFAISKNVKYIL